MTEKLDKINPTFIHELSPDAEIIEITTTHNENRKLEQVKCNKTTKKHKIIR